MLSLAVSKCCGIIQHFLSAFAKFPSTHLFVINSHLITVGIPVFNEEQTLARAINSVLNQTFQDFALFISDNSSTDNSYSICLDYAKQDPRIRLLRHHEGVPPPSNFLHLVNAARSEYFVFLAGDDYWEPDFLEKTYAVLVNEPQASCATVQVRITDNKSIDYYCKGTSQLQGERALRITSFLDQQPSDNSRFYGLFRTVILKESFKFRSERYYFHAYDWAVMALTVWRGDHLQVDLPLHVREYSGSLPTLSSIRNDNKHHYWLGLPLLPMSIYILRNIPIWAWPLILPSLVKLNIRMYAEYRKYDLGQRVAARLRL